MTLAPEVFDGALSYLKRRARTRAYRDDPVLWAKDMLDVDLWSMQQEIARSVRDNRNTAVAAGHGVGKSHLASVLMCWWVDVHPLDEVFVASTAPFQSQISAILWKGMRVFHALSKRRFEDGLIDHPLPGYITSQNEWKTDDGIIIGQGRKPPDSQEDSGYQGLHATYLLAIGDEAAGLSAGMVDALGNITTGEHNRLLLIANPTDPTSAMAKLWKTKNPAWNLMHVSVLDSPKITGEDFPAEKMSALSGWDYVTEKKSDWGEDDPRYISRVLGQWAFDAGNNLFTDVDLARAAATVVLPDPNGVPHFGCDIARMGDDATFVYVSRPGEIWETDPETGKPTKPTGRQGTQIRYLDHWVKTPLMTGDLDKPGSAEKIHLQAIGQGAKWLMVDAAGLGSGVIDGLAMHNGGQYEVVEVFGSAAPTDRRAYVNARAETYFEMKRRMYAGEIDLDEADADLFDELRVIVFEYTDRGQSKIESKDSMKKRGVKSPDRADAVTYASLDISPITENPLHNVEKGDRLSLDPWDEAFADDFGPLELPW